MLHHDCIALRLLPEHCVLLLLRVLPTDSTSYCQRITYYAVTYSAHELPHSSLDVHNRAQIAYHTYEATYSRALATHYCEHTRCRVTYTVAFNTLRKHIHVD
jgi:hypothetical protein